MNAHLSLASTVGLVPRRAGLCAGQDNTVDVLVRILILGVFMFQIREQFDSLDISHLEKLKED